jgi:hypothetical protein
MANKKLDIDPNLLLVGGVVALAYFGVLNPIFKTLGIKKSDEQKQDEQQERQAIDQAVKDSAKKQKQTYTDAQLKGFADTIHNAIKYSSVSDDYDKAGLYLAAPKNDTDVYRMIQLFGTRQETYFGVFTYNYNMQEMVRRNLSQSKLNAINDNYFRKGIKFRW